MLRSKAKQYVLYVHQDRVALTCAEKMRIETVTECPFTDPLLSRAIASCLEQLPQKTVALEIVFDDCHARFWQVTPPLHAARFSDLKAAARMRFDTLFGLPGNEWTIEAAWNAKNEFLACALPVKLIDSVQQALQSSPIKVKSHGFYPCFIQQWNQHAHLFGKKAGAFAVLGDASLTLALISETSIQSIRVVSIDHGDPQGMEALDKAIHSLSLQLGTEPPQEVFLAGRLHGPRRQDIYPTMRHHPISTVRVAAVVAPVIAPPTLEELA